VIKIRHAIASLLSYNRSHSEQRSAPDD
jgi:hypothetical protein